MYVTIEGIIKAAAVLSALTAFGTLFWKVFKWVNHQKEQDEKIRVLESKIESLENEHKEELQKLRMEMEQKINNLEGKHKEDMHLVQEELTLMTYGQLACLKGLQAQGCNGAVPEAIDRFEKHLNMRAHEQ